LREDKEIERFRDSEKSGTALDHDNVQSIVIMMIHLLVGA